MFVPSEFEDRRAEMVGAVLASYPLATMVVHTDQGLQANHIPLLADGDITYGDDNACHGRLIGHISRRNQLHHICDDGSDVLAIFRAEDAYISPNWYPTKADHHKHVPTWNYQAVHFYGTIRFIHDVKGLTAIVGKLTKYFEDQTNGKQGWKMADAPRDFIAEKLAGIVGFEIILGRCLAKSKLSQNRDEVDFANVADKMQENGKAFLAKGMTGLNKDPSA